MKQISLLPIWSLMFAPQFPWMPESTVADPWIKAEERIETVEQNMLSHMQSAFRTFDTALTDYSDNFLSAFAKHLTQCRKQVDDSQETLMRCFRDVLRGIQAIEANFSHNYDRFANRLTTVRRTINAQDKGLLSEAGHSYTRLNDPPCRSCRAT